jgi:hypothetical protein
MHLDLRTSRNAVATALLAFTVLAGSFARPAVAQTYGFATLGPGTLNHTSASAIA